MKIVYTELSEIKEATKNPKEHDIGAIITSIETFGFVSPLIVNTGTGRLVAGHGRREALLQMWGNGNDMPKGLKRVPKSSPEQWKVPVVEVEFETDEQAVAYLIADNRITELGGWIEQELVEVLTELSHEGTIDITGFDGDDLEAKRKALAGAFDPDEFGPDDEGNEPPPDLSKKTKLKCPDCGHEWLP